MFPLVVFIIVLAVVGLIAITRAKSGEGALVIGITVLTLLIGTLAFGSMFDTHEIRDVTICDKFETRGGGNVAIDGGETIMVERDVYGFLPEKGNATLELTRSALFGHLEVTKIYSNTTCMAGCTG